MADSATHSRLNEVLEEMVALARARKSEQADMSQSDTDRETSRQGR